MKRIIILSIVLLSLFTSTSVNAAKRNISEYTRLESIADSTIDLSILKSNLNQNISDRTAKLNFYLDARDLVKTNNYPTTFKMEIYDVKVEPKRLLTIFRPTLLSKRNAKKLQTGFDLENLQASSDLQIDLFNSNNEYQASYSTRIEIEGSDSITYLDLADSDCTGVFGKCQLDYIMQNIHMETTPEYGIETKIEKNLDGTYTVNLPLSKTRRTLQVKNVNKTLKGNSQNTSNLNFEFDGNNLYIIEDEQKILIGNQGQQGEPGEQGEEGPEGRTGAPGTSGSNKMDTVLLLPADANLPSSSPAIPDLGSNTHRILFDDATDESVNWTNIKIKNYASGALTARVGYSMTSAITNDIIFNVEMWCVSDGDVADIDSESYDAINATTAITVPGTAGNLGEFTITLTNTDSITEDDVCAFRLTRDADNVTDDATGDAEVRYLEISE
jgi:hypothetical protein